MFLKAHSPQSQVKETFDGPSESACYRNEPAGYDAFIIRHWYHPQPVISGAIRKLTGVHA